MLAGRGLRSQARSASTRFNTLALAAGQDMFNCFPIVEKFKGTPCQAATTARVSRKLSPFISFSSYIYKNADVFLQRRSQTLRKTANFKVLL
jgi:hypothetical protein